MANTGFGSSCKRERASGQSTPEMEESGMVSLESTGEHSLLGSTSQG